MISTVFVSVIYLVRMLLKFKAKSSFLRTSFFVFLVACVSVNSTPPQSSSSAVISLYSRYGQHSARRRYVLLHPLRADRRLEIRLDLRGRAEKCRPCGSDHRHRTGRSDRQCPPRYSRHARL